jgi:hypothetical protein
VRVLVEGEVCCYVDLRSACQQRGLGRAMLRGFCGRQGRRLLGRLGKTWLLVWRVKRVGDRFGMW